MPVPAADTALFLDGTSLQIARPSGPHLNQRNMYNGHHKVHCLQFQAVVAPNGRIVDFFGPIAGRRMTVMFLAKAVLLKHNRDSRFSTSTMQIKAISCRVMAVLLTEEKICHTFHLCRPSSEWE